MAQRLIPGYGYVNETGTRQAQVPGGAFVNETAAASSSYRALVVINGTVQQVPIGAEGFHIPLTLISGNIAQRTLTTQRPLVIDANGGIRVANASDTVIV